MKKRQKAIKIDNGLHDDQLIDLEKLNDSELNKRLEEEHTRADRMDEKTYKMTLIVSIGVTIVGILTSLIVNSVSDQAIKFVLLAMAQLAIFYSLISSFVAFGALRTLERFGYGSNFLVQAKENVLYIKRAIKAQETMNIIRHTRNECAYQLIRNSYLLLISVYLGICGYWLYVYFFPDFTNLYC